MRISVSEAKAQPSRLLARNSLRARPAGMPALQNGNGSSFKDDANRIPQGAPITLRGGNLSYKLVQFLHRRTAAYDFRFPIAVFFNPIRFQIIPSTPVFNRTLQLDAQFFKIQRLDQIIKGAKRHGFNSSGAGSICRHY